MDKSLLKRYLSSGGKNEKNTIKVIVALLLVTVVVGSFIFYGYISTELSKESISMHELLFEKGLFTHALIIFTTLFVIIFAFSFLQYNGSRKILKIFMISAISSLFFTLNAPFLMGLSFFGDNDPKVFFVLKTIILALCIIIALFSALLFGKGMYQAHTGIGKVCDGQ